MFVKENVDAIVLNIISNAFYDIIRFVLILLCRWFVFCAKKLRLMDTKDIIKLCDILSCIFMILLAVFCCALVFVLRHPS